MKERTIVAAMEQGRFAIKEAKIAYNIKTEKEDIILQEVIAIKTARLGAENYNMSCKNKLADHQIKPGRDYLFDLLMNQLSIIPTEVLLIMWIYYFFLFIEPAR